MKPEIKDDLSNVWQELGNHGARLTNLEAADLQVGQALVNHRAETSGNLKEFKEEVREILGGFRGDFKDLIGKVGHIQYFMYFSYGATAAVGAIFWLFTEWDNFKHLFGK